MKIIAVIDIRTARGRHLSSQTVSYGDVSTWQPETYPTTPPEPTGRAWRRMAMPTPPRMQDDEPAARLEITLLAEHDIEVDPIVGALMVANAWAGIDGAHHKDWVIDQMVRALLGPQYDAWRAGFESERKLTWEEGIAP